MHIAGFSLPFSCSQAVEVIVSLATLKWLIFTARTVRATSDIASKRGGRIRPETMHIPFLARVIILIQGLAFIVPPTVYLIALGLNKFHPPPWILNMAIPDNIVKPEWKMSLRLIACVITDGIMPLIMDFITLHLADQWHIIGRREKPRVVQTGPYAIVRHPGYSTMLIQQLLFTVMFWSYACLVTFAIFAGAIAIKMPIEEDIIQMDDAVRDEYKAYKKKVPARVIPFIW